MTVSVDFYIVIGQAFTDRWGGMSADGRPSVRVTKGKPALAKEEIALRMELELPDSLFIKPTLTAKVTIPDAGPGLDLSAIVREGIAQAIKEQTGVVLTIEGPT